MAELLDLLREAFESSSSWGNPNEDEEETLFRDWYSGHAESLGLNPNPDGPRHFYDWRAAWRAGASPDESGHWPSAFKLEGHPRLVLGGIDTRTGQAAGPTGVQRTLDSPEGFNVPRDLFLRPVQWLGEELLETKRDLGKLAVGIYEGQTEPYELESLGGRALEGLGEALGTWAGRAERAGRAVGRTAQRVAQSAGEALEALETTSLQDVKDWLNEEPRKVNFPLTLAAGAGLAAGALPYSLGLVGVEAAKGFKHLLKIDENAQALRILENPTAYSDEQVSGAAEFLDKSFWSAGALMFGGAPLVGASGGKLSPNQVNAFIAASPRAVEQTLKLLDKGYTVNQVFRATRTAPTVAGMLSEISDVGLGLKISPAQNPGRVFRLGEAISHPEIERRFPDAWRESKLYVHPTADFGGYGENRLGPGGLIQLPAKEPSRKLLETLGHELGHFTAHETGLPPGGSPEDILISRFGPEVSAIRAKLKGFEARYGKSLSGAPLDALVEITNIFERLKDLKNKATQIYWDLPGEHLGRAAGERALLSDLEKYQTPLPGELTLRAGSKETPFFSALVKRWSEFRAGKGAAQKAFTPEKLLSILPKVGSKEELQAGGLLEVLRRLPKGTELPVEKIDRWVERADLSKRVKNIDLKHSLGNPAEQALVQRVAEGTRKIMGHPPQYEKTFLAPFTPVAKGDYWEEALSYGGRDKGLLLGMPSAKGTRDYADALERKVYGGRTEKEALGEYLEAKKLYADINARIMARYEQPSRDRDYKKIKAELNGTTELLASMQRGGSYPHPVHSSYQDVLEGEDLSRFTYLTQRYDNSYLAKATKDLEKMTQDFAGFESKRNERIAELRERMISDARKSAGPPETPPYHLEGVDPNIFAWTRNMKAVEPETGKQGVFLHELQSNLSAEVESGVTEYKGAFSSRGIGPAIDNALFKAAQRGDEFVAIPITDRKWWSPRYGVDEGFLATDQEGKFKNYKWLEALYGERGAAAQQITARIRSLTGQKPLIETKMLQFSSARAKGEVQHQPAVVIKLSPEAREAILEKGFKISKLDSLRELALEAFA